MNIVRLRKAYASYPEDDLPLLLALGLAIGDAIVFLGFASQAEDRAVAGARFYTAWRNFRLALRLREKIPRPLPKDMQRCLDFLKECLPEE